MLERSHSRRESGPRAADGKNGRIKSSFHHRRLQDSEDRDRPCAKRVDEHRSGRKEVSHRRKPAATVSSPTVSEEPGFVLDMIGQPSKYIQLGTSVELSVMISLTLDSLREPTIATNVDSSSLVAVVSLVTDSHNGERLSVEAGSLTGQKMFDSVHPVDQGYLEVLPQARPCRAVLGYVSFPLLLVRQHGSYRIRTTLLQMSNDPRAGATSLMSIDSEPIEVRRGNYRSLPFGSNVCS